MLCMVNDKQDFNLILTGFGIIANVKLIIIILYPSLNRWTVVLIDEKWHTSESLTNKGTNNVKKKYNAYVQNIYHLLAWFHH